MHHFRLKPLGLALALLTIALIGVACTTAAPVGPSPTTAPAQVAEPDRGVCPGR